MIEHYDAFISYKHAPRDIKVAEAVQKGLEHFRVPGKIRKVTGKKRIERIFRDKDELPITSSLGDTISYALEHSDYLIVICSERTKESVWVEREIAYFLRSHSKQQVLTVLVDGEPENVIPPILQYEDKTIMGPDDRTSTVQIPLEPLSCDFRLPMRKAKRVELPRLASAILGCSYDELMNRRRHYAIRRLTIAFAAFAAAAAGVTIYLLYSRAAIQRNYQNSLRNQSRYLANESGNLLQDEQRITALQLALEALPKDEKDKRPVLPEAVRALTDATRAYVTDSGSCISAEWNYRLPDYIADFQVSDDGSRLIAIDASGVAALWNTRTHERLLVIMGEDHIPKRIQFCNNDRFMVIYREEIRMYDAEDGTLLWKKIGEFEDASTYDSGCVFVEETGSFFYLFDKQQTLRKYSVEIGNKEEEYKLPSEYNGETVYIYAFAVSPNGKMVAWYGSVGFGFSFVLSTFDTESGRSTFTETGSQYPGELYWTNDENVVFSVSEDALGSSSSFGNYSILKVDHTLLKCYRAENMEPLWESVFTCSDVSLHKAFLRLPESRTVAYCAGNKADVLDLEKGTVLYSYELNNPIVEMADPDGDGKPAFVTQSGGLGLAGGTETDPYVVLYPYFTDYLTDAVINGGIYVQKNMAREVICYGLHVSDESWVEIDHSFQGEDLSTCYMEENAAVFLQGITDSVPETFSLVYVNFESLDKVFRVGLEPVDAYSYRYLGTDQDYIYLVSSEDFMNAEMTRVEISSGIVLPAETLEGISPAGVRFQDGAVCYLEDAGEDLNLVRYNMTTGERKKNRIPDMKSYQIQNYFLFPGSGLVYMEGTAESWILDMNEDRLSVLSDAVRGTGDPASYVAVNQDDTGLFLITSGSAVMADKEGSFTYSIPLQGLTPLAADFYAGEDGKEILLLVFDGGTLNRYDAGTGKLIGSGDITSYYGKYNDILFQNDPDGGYVYIQYNNMVDVLETGTWVEVANIQECAGHHLASDRFLTISRMSSKEERLGYFEHYTVEDLVKKGNDILQGTRLTDELRSFYGLDEEE